MSDCEKSFSKSINQTEKFILFNHSLCKPRFHFSCIYGALPFRNPNWFFFWFNLKLNLSCYEFPCDCIQLYFWGMTYQTYCIISLFPVRFFLYGNMCVSLKLQMSWETWSECCHRRGIYCSKNNDRLMNEKLPNRLQIAVIDLMSLLLAVGHVTYCVLVLYPYVIFSE